MGAPHRRTIYIASLEAHVDRLHAQLLSIGLYPIPFEKLEPYRGLNSKTAKVRRPGPSLVRSFSTFGPQQSMVAGLQNDTSHTKLKMLELERSVRRFLFPRTTPWILIFKSRPTPCVKLWQRHMSVRFDATRLTLPYLRGIITPGTNPHPVASLDIYLIHLFKPLFR
jgi:hypothetical protein